MDKYQSKLNFDFLTNQLILKEIGLIDSFKGKWNVVIQSDTPFLKKLRRDAFIESIGSSTRIEGARLTNTEIVELLNSKDPTKLETSDQQEVLGYSEALEMIQLVKGDIRLTKDAIQQLHHSFLIYNTGAEMHRGKYKTQPNRVVSTNSEGYRRIIFNTTEPTLVSKEMSELLAWTNQQLKSNLLHPIIVIGLFIYEFLVIHPFQDRNSSLSCLLTNHLLLHSNYKFIRFISFEGLIEGHKNEYFKALKVGQINRYSYEERIDKWMLFFIHSLVTLTLELEQKYASVKLEKSYLNPRQKRIIDFIKNHQPVKLADLDQGMKEISINTFKKDLQYLKSKQFIECTGKNRGATYSIKIN